GASTCITVQNGIVQIDDICCTVGYPNRSTCTGRGSFVVIEYTVDNVGRTSAKCKGATESSTAVVVENGILDKVTAVCVIACCIDSPPRTGSISNECRIGDKNLCTCRCLVYSATIASCGFISGE